MGWLIALLWLVCAPLLLWSLINPRSAWLTTASWQFRDPRANEPSDAGYAVQRASAGIGLFMIGVVTLALVVAIQNRHRADADRTARGPEGSTDAGIQSYHLGAGDDLVLTTEDQSLDDALHSHGSGCVLTAQVVEETDTEVTVSARLEPVLEGDGTTCHTTYGEYGDVTVTLSQPLGDRQVFTDDHSRVSYKPS